MNRVQGISNAYVDAAREQPLEWLLVALMFVLAFFIGGAYLHEKFIRKRRFQAHAHLKTVSSKTSDDGLSSSRPRVIAPPYRHGTNKSPPRRGR